MFVFGHWVVLILFLLISGSLFYVCQVQVFCWTRPSMNNFLLKFCVVAEVSVLEASSIKLAPVYAISARCWVLVEPYLVLVGVIIFLDVDLWEQCLHYPPIFLCSPSPCGTTLTHYFSFCWEKVCWGEGVLNLWWFLYPFMLQLAGCLLSKVWLLLLTEVMFCCDTC